MSMYADYLKERTEDRIIETEGGFATYRFLGADTVYIVDIYVKPEMRKRGLASQMADQIAEIAKKRGCKEMLGSVVPSAKGSTRSLQVLLAYGMELKTSGNDFIFLRKDL